MKQDEQNRLVFLLWHLCWSGDRPGRRLTFRGGECEALRASPRYSIPDQTPQTSATNGHARATQRRR